MRNKTLWMKKMLAAGVCALSATCLFAPLSSVAADDADDAALEEELDEEMDSEEDYSDDEILFDDDDFLFEEYEMSPEEEELDDYIYANGADELLLQFDSFRYEQKMWNAQGEENELSGYVYRDKDLIYASYVDGFVEMITADRDEGFDPGIGVPVRYVFGDEESREDNIENYQELFYLWGDEEIADRIETDDKLTYITRNTDSDFVAYMLDEIGLEADEEALETAVLEREIIFDIKTKLMERSTVKLILADGSEEDVFTCGFTVNPENGYEIDEELFAKLNAEDKHSLKLVIEPGTNEEQTVEDTVGKGCAFYPLVYDGYTYYLNKECTLAATEEDLYETEEDVVLYATFEEIPEEEYEFDLDGDEIDLSDLFEIVDEDEDIADEE